MNRKSFHKTYPLVIFVRVSSEPHACCLTSLRSARGSWNRNLSELVEQKLVDLKCFLFHKASRLLNHLLVSYK